MQFNSGRRDAVRFDPDLLARMASNHSVVMDTAKMMASTIIAHSPKQKCDLELEVCFNELPPTKAQLIMTMLDYSPDNWDSFDGEWQSLTDSFVRAGEQMLRVRRTKTSRTRMFKTVLCRVDGTSSVDPDLAMRFNVKTEHEPTKEELSLCCLAIPELLRGQHRRTFTMVDEYSKQSFEYSVSRAWMAKSAQELEMLMTNEQKDHSVRNIEIETLFHWDPDSPVSADDMLVACASLLLKAQDMIALLTNSPEITFGTIRRPKSRPPIPRPLASSEKQRRHNERRRVGRKRDRSDESDEAQAAS